MNITTSYTRGAAYTMGLAIVRKSLAPDWPRWGVFHAEHKTRWYKTEAEAQRRADKLNGKR